MKRILLIRHGESAGNVDLNLHHQLADHAIPLSDRGRQQAREAGVFLKEYLLGLDPKPSPNSKSPPVRLWTSPYRRTRETSDAIELGLQQAGALRGLWDRREHVLLCEQQFGLFDGIPNEELATRFPAEYAHYDKCERFEGKFWARMPLGESRFDVAQRVHQAFGTFHRDADRHGVETIIVVCHGVTVRAFVMMWCHKTPEWFESEKNPANCSIRLIENNEDRGYIFNTSI